MSSASALFVTPRPSFLRFIVDRNPFFLLSAVCMFAGVRIILSALNVSPGDLPRLLLLIFTLNIYEALVIALALFLILRRGQLRDGWMLLSIEALFLVDLTDLNAELFTANLRWGVGINLICWLFALIKVSFVLRLLKLRISASEFTLIAVQLAAIFFLAGVFKQWAHQGPGDGSLSPRVLYITWWIVGAAIGLASGMLTRPSPGSSARPMAALPGRLYLFLPLIALLVHLCGANRVYALTFQPANVAPVLLGLAVLLARGRTGIRRSTLLACQIGLTVIAICLSNTAPAFLQVQLGSHHFSALRLTLLASGGVMALALIQSWQVLAAPLAALSVIAALLGNTLQDIGRNLRWFIQALYDFVQHLIPETPLQWGLVAVLSAFLMLAIGAIVSLRKAQDPTHKPSTEPPLA